VEMMNRMASWAFMALTMVAVMMVIAWAFR
jgi:hypothetical protein